VAQSAHDQKQGKPEMKLMKTIKVALLTIALLLLTGWNWIELVSQSSTGEQGNGTEDFAAVSADGRYVAFHSTAGNLVPADTNGRPDVFVRDTFDGTTTRVSVSSTGDQAIGGSSLEPSISADGRYVAFYSSAGNLVMDDTNGDYDIFVHDTLLGTTSRATVDRSHSSYEPSISDDGRYVAFRSLAALVADDTNLKYDIFVRDMVAGTTIRATVNSEGAQAIGGLDLGGTAGVEPSISGDGRYVAFASAATNLVENDTNGDYDVFVHDTVDRTTTRVSMTHTGDQAVGGGSLGASISNDGRYVAFYSDAVNLVAGDTNGQSDVFVHDRVAGGTTRVSVASTGQQGDGGSSLGPALSGDGRYVAFYSAANNLVADDTNGVPDVFVHDTVHGTTSRVSLDQNGVETIGGGSDRPSISKDGLYVVFRTSARNLVPNDTNGQRDIIIRAVPEVTISSVSPRKLHLGTTENVTISGTNFLAGAVPSVENASVHNVVIVDENTIMAAITIPPGAPTGTQETSVKLDGTGPGVSAGATGVCTDCVVVPTGC
jgi:Tol biopolymer transport system component